MKIAYKLHSQNVNLDLNLDFIDLQSFLYLSRVIKYKLSKTIEVVKLDIAKI